MNDEYFVTEYDQIVDLYANMQNARQIACEMSADNPFLCSFLNDETISQIDTENLPMKMMKNFSGIVNPDMRYMVIRQKEVPTKLVVSRKPNSSQIASRMGYNAPATSSIYQKWWFWTIIIAVIILIGIIWWWMAKSKSKSYPVMNKPSYVSRTRPSTKYFD